MIATLPAAAQGAVVSTEMLINATTTLESFPQEDWSQQHYPPAPILWMTSIIDTMCDTVFFGVCHNWRHYVLPTTNNNTHQYLSYLSVKVPSLSASLPPLLSFQEYCANQAADNPSNQETWYTLAWKYATQTNSTALGDLCTPTALTALLVTVLLLRSVKHIVLPLFAKWGTIVAQQTHGTNWTMKHPERIMKFAEYVFRLLYHSTISILGLYWFYYQEPWWDFHSFDTRSHQHATLYLFVGFPYHDVTPTMIWYYLLQAAYNLDALISLLELSLIWNTNNNNNNNNKPDDDDNTTTDTDDENNHHCNCHHHHHHRPWWKHFWKLEWSPNVRGDFNEMFIHHVITNLLVMGSSKCRLTRIGSMVFLLHDISDIPVDLSKLFNFVKFKIMTVMSFCSMVALWCYTRLYLLPFVLYRAVLTQSHLVTQLGLDPLLYLVYRHAFYVLMGCLIALHVIWFGMFLQIFHSLLIKRKVEDLSEHKHGEQYDEGEEDNETNEEQDRYEVNKIATVSGEQSIPCHDDEVDETNNGSNEHRIDTQQYCEEKKDD